MEHYDSALVLGLGVSGQAAAELLLGEGTRVTVTDARASLELEHRAGALRALGAEVLLGSPLPPADTFEVCIISPGVSVESEAAEAAARSCGKTIPELELGWSRSAARVLAVTGSNGKSTMVKLCHEALGYGGFRSAIAGNYGPPVSAISTKSDPLDWLVVEVSSFQLETADEFRPDVGVLLNVFPNHLDRHHSVEEYRKSKLRMFRRMSAQNTAIVSAQLVGKLGGNIPGQGSLCTFGTSDDADVWYDAGNIYCTAADGDTSPAATLSIRGSTFDNIILGAAAAAATSAMKACGVSVQALGKAVASFEPLPHRMEPVAAVNGVKVVNDSKATNIAAMCAALQMCNPPIRLIAGGMLKESDLSVPQELLASKVRAVYLFGDAQSRMESAWRDTVTCCSSSCLREALSRAFHDAEEGDTILLSPACASFDQFVNFEDRGNQFKKMVASLMSSPIKSEGAAK